jgi:hypothetical protein
MKSITTKHHSSQPIADTAVYLFDDWFDPIEAAVRTASSLKLAGQTSVSPWPPPVPSKHLTRCLRNRVQATH